MDALASKVRFYDAIECYVFMPEDIAELAKLTKFVQLSLVIYCNDMEFD